MNEEGPHALGESKDPARFGVHDVVRIAALLWIAVALFAFWTQLSIHWGDDAEMMKRDFYCFYRAGELFLQGRDPFSDLDHRFVNPPFTLPLAAGLSRLGLRGAYVGVSIVSGIAWISGVIVSSRFGVASPSKRATVCIALLTAPASFLALHLGQLSGIYFLLLASSLLLLMRGSDRTAGCVAALLLAKPNLLVAIFLAALLLRRWRFVMALAIAGALLVLSSVPLGEVLWAQAADGLADLSHTHDTLAGQYWRQFTVYAFFRSAFHGLDASGVVARVLTAGVLLGFGVLIYRVVRQHRARWQEPLWGARLASIIVLSTCALNIYLFYYDSVFIALPVAMLVLAKDAWTSRNRWRIAVVLALAAWLLQLVTVFWQQNPPLFGVVCAVWLAVELWDLRALKSEASEQEPRVESPTARLAPAP